MATNSNTLPASVDASEWRQLWRVLQPREPFESPSVVLSPVVALFVVVQVLLWSPELAWLCQNDIGETTIAPSLTARYRTRRIEVDHHQTHLSTTIIGNIKET
jgi:hypothetical protein